MLKIKVDGKELKGIIEKTVCNMDKKASLAILRKVVLESQDGFLKAITDKNVEQYLEVRTDVYTSIEDGRIAIDEQDLKVIIKMTGNVELTEMENKIVVKNGKKNISLMKHDLTGFPDEPKEDFNPKIQMQESELAEALSNLSVFLEMNSNNILFQCFNFNLLDGRIEALEGHRIGIKRIDDIEKVGVGNFTLHGIIIADLKKTFNKKSKDNIVISAGEKYIKVAGKDFTYYTRVIDGEYFKINSMIKIDAQTECEINVADALGTVRYYTENVLTKADKTPIILKFANGSISTYSHNDRMEVADEIANSNFVGREMTIGFNPYFVLDALKIADSDNVNLELVNPKAPIMITAVEYSFLILSINVADGNMKRMEEYISKVETA